jgi:CRISPR-associated protein Csd1
MNLERLIDLQSKLVADGKLHPVTDFEPRRFAFLINLDPSGFVSRPASDLRAGPKTPDENGRIYQAPVTDRTSGTNANLLYDTREYVLGTPVSSEPKKIDRAKDRLTDFKRKVGIIRSLTHQDGRTVPELEAIWNFYHANEGAYFEEFLRSDSFKEIMDAPYSLWISFRLEGTSYPVFNTPDLEPYLVPSNLIPADRSGQCLVTGQTGLLGDIHTPIRGVVGAQETGAALVSFNQKACNSYGLEATENAPILRSVTRGYGRGLNYLLKDQRHHIRIGNGKYPGDGSILIWDDTHTTTGIPEVLVGDMLEASDREHVIENFRTLRDRVVVDGTVPRPTAGTVYALELKANSARTSC